MSVLCLSLLIGALPGEFPVLQAKMHSVLKPEVEAVRFLKEEPHKMDSMLKRVKGLTETLSSLRRYSVTFYVVNHSVLKKVDFSLFDCFIKTGVCLIQ